MLSLLASSYRFLLVVNKTKISIGQSQIYGSNDFVKVKIDCNRSLCKHS